MPYVNLKLNIRFTVDQCRPFLQKNCLCFCISQIRQLDSIWFERKKNINNAFSFTTSHGRTDMTTETITVPCLLYKLVLFYPACSHQIRKL